MRIVTKAASRRASLRINAAYHLVEKPPHTVTSCEALNEYATRMRIGRYRNAKPNVSAVARTQDKRRLMAGPRTDAPRARDRRRSG